MLVEAARHCEVIGSLRINEIQRILQFDSHEDSLSTSNEDSLSTYISRKQLTDVMDDMMIVIPVKDERMNLLDGVLKAIPDRCHVCIVSNSKRKRRPSFNAEEGLVRDFHNITKHRVCLIHQKDKALGDSLKAVGYGHILDEDGVIRNGKAEGMMAALLLAKHFGKKYIGFIDADNYIPGAVNEYVTDFAAGFCMSESPHALVRLHWRHKPKIIKDTLHFRKWGRVSETTNRYLNQLIGEQTRFGTDIIKTANAGEHAITMPLAEKMDYSTGYSIEPYHIIHLLESYGKDGNGNRDIVKKGIDIRQIETLNPHLHEQKGRKHIDNMLLGALSTVYHSRLSSETLKSRITEELRIKGVIERADGIPENTTIPSIADVDTDRLMKGVMSESDTFLSLP